MTTTIPSQRLPEPQPDEQDDDDIWRPTREELTAAIQADLDEFGLTREELARQAAENDFQSWSAKSLWMMIEVSGA
ncbi:hypothetical protein [Dactylosporangium sp. CA-092794]|uniref:hypothetical protein n=1 Tax=Dactylosporangium sp. CA-092794 TaxID=3239929 RepID=UPI003D920EAF